MPHASLVQLTVTLAALFLVGCVSTPAPKVSIDDLPPSQVDLATRNLRVFNAAWSLVMDKHFDPKLQGVDWPAAAKQFGPEAATAADKKSLYTAINRMLDLLKDSHTHALTPAASAGLPGTTSATAQRPSMRVMLKPVRARTCVCRSLACSGASAWVWLSFSKSTIRLIAA